MHVDDALVGSFIFGPCCLESGCELLFPKDVGVSKEGEGPELEFLHCLVSVSDAFSPDALRATPRNPNKAFARGEDHEPKIAKLPPWLGRGFSDFATQKANLTCKLASADQVLEGSAVGNLDYVVDLGAEAARLRWPLAQISLALCAYPRHVRSDFAMLVRAVGRVWRKFRKHAIGDTTAWADLRRMCENEFDKKPWLKTALNEVGR